MKNPKKPRPKETKPRIAIDPGLSIPPETQPKNPAPTDTAADALKRLSKMTPEEQAAALFQTMLASSGKKSW